MKKFPIISTILMLSASSAAFANPQGFQVAAGEASISYPDASTVEVTTGKQTIVNWDSFSVGQQETMRFVMPSSSSAVLNRVMGGDLSQILGTLEANGKVFLINPKGVLVGQDALVNTASFIASGFDIRNDQFLQGGDIAFESQGVGGSVVNLGKITAWDGDVLLVGYKVSNEGTIEAPNGLAALAAGTEVLLRPAGNERVLIRAQLTELAADEYSVENTGSISALQAELKTDGNAYAKAIRHEGTIDALGTQAQAGRVLLVAGSGALETTGKITAKNADGTGGEVRLLGTTIDLLDQALIMLAGILAAAMS